MNLSRIKIGGFIQKRFKSFANIQQYRIFKQKNYHSYIHKHLRHFSGNNSAFSGTIGQYADNQYLKWLQDKTSVDNSWNEYFTKYESYFSSGAFLNTDGAPNVSRNGDGTVNLNSLDVQQAINDATNCYDIKIIYIVYIYGIL